MKAVPEPLHTVTPRLVVRDGAAAIEFYEWMLSQRIEDVSPEEMARRAAEFFG